jgi:hypothetical protein
MIIFAKKHFSHKNARLLSLLIKLAIYFRAGLAIINRFLRKSLLPFLDFLLIYGGLFLITRYWEKNVIFLDGGSYPIEFKTIVLTSYIIVWLISTYLSGGYDVPVRFRKVGQGIVLGTVFILVIYALLPETIRFSRAIILIGSAWAIAAMIFNRIILNMLKFKSARLERNKNKRFIVIGDAIEAQRVSDLLMITRLQPGFIGLVHPQKEKIKRENFIGNLSQIREIINIYKIDEVIFCSKNLSHQQIIDHMSELQNPRIDFKIAPEDSLSIIGSNSINTRGDLYTIQINAISTATNRRNKRMFDLFTGIMLLLLSPLLIFTQKNPAGFLRNIFLVLFARLTWIGYEPTGSGEDEKLPKIKKGVLSPIDAFEGIGIPEDTVQKLNVLYARDYTIASDLNILWKGYRSLGR